MSIQAVFRQCMCALVFTQYKGSMQEAFGRIQAVIMRYLANNQGVGREYSGSIQKGIMHSMIQIVFIDYSMSVRLVFLVHSGSVQTIFKRYSGSIQGAFRQYTGYIQTLLKVLSENIQSAHV